MESSQVLRFEIYLTFHLAETLKELKKKDEGDSDSDLICSAERGSSANTLKNRLLRSHDEIKLALARIEEGSFGTCLRCGNEIDLRRLEVVPWSKFCMLCQEESDQRQATAKGNIVMLR